MNFDSLLNICVFIGGCSVEHEISLISGLQAVLNLDKNVYDVRVVFLSKDNEFIYLKALESMDYFKQGKHLGKKSNCYFKRNDKQTYMVYKNKKWRVDVCFPIVHGKGVEDGTLSGLISLLKVPNVCSDITASCIAQDKGLCKNFLKSKGIRMSKYFEVTKENKEKKLAKILNVFNFPMIVKPATLGSSIGIGIVDKLEDLSSAIDNGLLYDNKVVVEEKFEDFIEYNMACFSYNGVLYPSLVEEVSSNHEYLTFDDKYGSGGLKQTTKDNRKVPAVITQELEEEIKNYTKIIYRTLGFSGVIRVDYIFDKTTNKLYFNEVNTIPGSLAFYLYKEFSFKELLDMLIKDAMFKFEQKKDMISSFDSNILSIKDLKMKK